MARKVKGSSNWKKAKARVQRIHARIANARNDFLHKASNTISKNHATGRPRRLAGAQHVQISKGQRTSAWAQRPR
jgi:transposase